MTVTDPLAGASVVLYRTRPTLLAWHTSQSEILKKSDEICLSKQKGQGTGGGQPGSILNHMSQKFEIRI